MSDYVYADLSGMEKKTKKNWGAVGTSPILEGHFQLKNCYFYFSVNCDIDL